MEQLLEPAVQAGAFGVCALLIALMAIMGRAWMKQSADREEQQTKREERILCVIENNTKAYTKLNDSLVDQEKQLNDVMSLQRKNRELLVGRPCLRQQGGGD